MVTKTITITEDAYMLLKQRKTEGESFSQVIAKLAKQKGDIWDHFGAWKDMPEEDFKAIKKAIKDQRELSNKHLMERLKQHEMP